MDFIDKQLQRAQRVVRRRVNAALIAKINKEVHSTVPLANERPVVFFYASTRLGAFSQNAAFSLLASLGVRTKGVPVVQFACRRGMTHCVLGTDPENSHASMPCQDCIRLSEVVYPADDTRWFEYHHDAALADTLAQKSIPELMAYEHPITEDWHSGDVIPLGQIVLPAIRWRLRLHDLLDDEATRFLYRQFLLSAWNVAHEFKSLLDQTDPQAVVLFNGQFYPEATARWLSLQHGIRVITHEVGLRPLTGYFTTGEATAYPIDIPEDFELSTTQNARLDDYLTKRMRGDFTMAGIKFWPEMQGLDDSFLAKAAGFKYIVPIFTNVIFDTSQPHSNVVFSDMFTWLDTLLATIIRHPETLFVLRAHPDESRSGKAARQSVADWASRNDIESLPNVVFVPSEAYLSSYELILRSKFVMIYNSTIGLEASIMGMPVLCAGKARFTSYPTVFFPTSVEAYQRQLEEFLDSDQVQILPEHQRYARRFLYYQLYFTSLPFDQYLELGENRSAVWLKQFDVIALKPENSPTLRAILDGLFAGGDFLLDEKDVR